MLTVMDITEVKNDRGVLILATGNSHYGKLAFNLAMSLKANDRLCQIALVCEPETLSNLSDLHKGFFDYIIDIPKECITHNGEPHHFKAKTELYWLSPFNKTLFIDADSLWIPKRKVSWLFGELEGIKFTVQNNCYYDVLQRKTIGANNYIFWGNIDEILSYFDITDRLIQTNTTLMYWERSEIAEKIFTTALEIYENDNAPKQKKKWGYADEFCFNVSMRLNNFEPHEIPWRPVFIHFLNTGVNNSLMMSNYWLITNGGAKTNPVLVKFYNTLVNAYCVTEKVPDRYYHIDKEKVIAERK